jgi:hypothetical protein
MSWIEQGTCNQRPGEQLVAIEQEGFGIVCAVLDYEGESVYRILRAMNSRDALLEACKGLLSLISDHAAATMLSEQFSHPDVVNAAVDSAVAAIAKAS